jgi:hypothetical protein
MSNLGQSLVFLERKKEEKESTTVVPLCAGALSCRIYRPFMSVVSYLSVKDFLAIY